MPVDPEQAKAALGKANTVRAQRKELKRRLKLPADDPDRVEWVRLFCGSDSQWEGVARAMTLEMLVLAVPGVGRVTLGEVLEEVGLAGDFRVGGLTFALRAQVADRLRLALAGEPLPPAPGPPEA